MRAIAESFGHDARVSLVGERQQLPRPYGLTEEPEHARDIAPIELAVGSRGFVAEPAKPQWTVDRELLSPRLGALASARLAEVWQGVKLVCEPEEPSGPQAT